MMSKNPSASNAEITPSMLKDDLRSYYDRRAAKAVERLFEAYDSRGSSISSTWRSAAMLPVLVDPRIKTSPTGEKTVVAHLGVIYPMGRDGWLTKFASHQPIGYDDFAIQYGSPFCPGIGLMRVNPAYYQVERYPYYVRLHVESGRVDFLNARYVSDIVQGHKSYRNVSWKVARSECRWILREIVDLSINYSDVYRLIQTMFALIGMWGRDQRFSDYSTFVLEYAASVVITEQPWAQEILSRYVHQ